VVDSGELLFQAILIHCKSSAAHGVAMLPASVSEQFPIAPASSRYFSQSLSGLLTTTL